MIPLTPDLSTSVKNRYIKDAAEELKSIGYIQGYEIEDHEEGRGIRFIFDYSKYDDKDKDVYGLDNYNTLEDVIMTLKENGFNQEEIEKYIRLLDIEYIKALLRYFDIMMNYDKISKNPKGFLEKGLKETYNIDLKYYSAHRTLSNNY